jgi:hypothetical protein
MYVTSTCLSHSQIRKLFNLGKDDDVRKYVNTYRRTFESNGKKHSKAPRIQRLVTPETLQRKRRKAAVKKAKHEKSRTEAAEYHKLLVQVGCAGFLKLGLGLLVIRSGRTRRLAPRQQSTTRCFTMSA